MHFCEVWIKTIVHIRRNKFVYYCFHAEHCTKCYLQTLNGKDHREISPMEGANGLMFTASEGDKQSANWNSFSAIFWVRRWRNPPQSTGLMASPEKHRAWATLIQLFLRKTPLHKNLSSAAAFWILLYPLLLFRLDKALPDHHFPFWFERCHLKRIFFVLTAVQEKCICQNRGTEGSQIISPGKIRKKHKQNY